MKTDSGRILLTDSQAGELKRLPGRMNNFEGELSNLVTTLHAKVDESKKFEDRVEEKLDHYTTLILDRFATKDEAEGYAVTEATKVKSELLGEMQTTQAKRMSGGAKIRVALISGIALVAAAVITAITSCS